MRMSYWKVVCKIRANEKDGGKLMDLFEDEFQSDHGIDRDVAERQAKNHFRSKINEYRSRHGYSSDVVFTICEPNSRSVFDKWYDF